MTLRERVDALVKHAAPIHPGTGTDQSVHGGKQVTSLSGKEGIIFDTLPAQPIGRERWQESAESIFNATLETNGSKYTATIDEGGVRVYSGGDDVMIEGTIYQSDGDTVARVSASLDAKFGVVKDISFFMEPGYQDEGVGTMFIAHWMEEATSVGFHRFEVGTYEIGQYAWAMAGFDWDQESMDRHMKLLDSLVLSATDGQDVDLSDVTDYGTFVPSWLEYDAFQEFEQDEWLDEAETLVQRWRGGEHINPVQVALIGVDSKKQVSEVTSPRMRSMHFGKGFMLAAGSWHGFLELGEVKKSLDHAHATWMRWAKTDPRAVERDDPRFLAELASAVIRKHGGPGPHVGTGTPQEVHGGDGRGKVVHTKFGWFIVDDDDTPIGTAPTEHAAQVHLSTWRTMQARGEALLATTGFNPYLDSPPPGIEDALETDPAVLLDAAKFSWKGNPGDMSRNMADLVDGVNPTGPNTNIKVYEDRNQARLLLREIENASAVDYKLYRGQKSYPINLKRAGDMSIDIGDEIEWSWAGTTPDQNLAIGFGSRKDWGDKDTPQYLFRFSSGTHAFPVNRRADGVLMGGFQHEDEHLVSGRFRVTGVATKSLAVDDESPGGRGEPSDYIVVDVEQVKHFVKHGGPGPHSGTGSPQAVHGKPVHSYGTHPEEGTIFDAVPAQDRGPSFDGKEIFEATLETGGKTYKARVVEEHRMSLRYTTTDRKDVLKVKGVIEHVNGSMLDPVGEFTRYLQEDGRVINDSFNINPEFRGSGVGTMFLSHWEDELAAAGFKEMEVTAVNVGRYAWAVAGYDFATDNDREEAITSLTFEIEEAIENDEKPSWFSDADAVLNMERPTPLDFALMGQGEKWSGDMHFGKSFMLNFSTGWTGVKPLRVQKSLDAARATWKRWADSNPRAIEQDDPSFLAEMAVASFAKHYPGQHDQTDHGNWARTSVVTQQYRHFDAITNESNEPGQGWNKIRDLKLDKARYGGAIDSSIGPNPGEPTLYESIKQHGITSPIGVMEKDGERWVVDGHTRLAAAEALGMAEVPIRVLDKPPNNDPQLRAFFAKHGGPGPHVGTGSPQEAHAGGMVTPENIIASEGRTEGVLGGMTLGELGSKLSKGPVTVSGITFSNLSQEPKVATYADLRGLQPKRKEWDIYIRNATGTGGVSGGTLKLIWDKDLGFSMQTGIDTDPPMTNIDELRWGLFNRFGIKVGPSLVAIPTIEQLQQFAPGEDLPDFSVETDRMALEDFEDARDLIFGDPFDVPGQSSGIGEHTVAGKENVAMLMEMDHGDDIRAEGNEEIKAWNAAQKSFLDHAYTGRYGTVSTNGYDAEGNPTWRKYTTDPIMEGQLAMTGGITGTLAPIVDGPGHQRMVTDVDDPYSLENWIEWEAHSTNFDVQDLEGHYTEWMSEDVWEYIGVQSTEEGTPLVRDILSQTADAQGNINMQDVVQYLRDQWATSATHPTSIAVQLAVENKFNIHPDATHWMDQAHTDGRLLYDRLPHLFDAYVDAVYANTQVTLRNAGLTHLPLVRGMGLNYDHVPTLSDSDAGGGKWNRISMTLQPLSSFSLSPTIAAGFSDPSDQVTQLSAVIRTVVPIERVWGLSIDGFGAVRETEAIVIGDTNVPADMAYWTETTKTDAQGYYHTREELARRFADEADVWDLPPTDSSPDALVKVYL